MDACLLILSGGLDSTVSAYLAREETTIRLALFFDYGQRAAGRERDAASQVAKSLDVPFEELELPWLNAQSQSALTDFHSDLPQLTCEQLDEISVTQNSARDVWVPNRNGVFLNIAAAYAEGLGANFVVTGFNAEEAVTFSDNSHDFVEAANRFFSYATQNGVQVISYTQDWDKAEIIRRGLALDVPFESVWSCYEGGERQCGRCESCLRSIRAYQQAGIWERMKGRFIL